MVEDHRTAPIDERRRALFDYVQAANDARGTMDTSVVERARAAGWSESALYDAATVVALFNFYNRWIDATGVGDLPAAGYEMSGKRLAENGYQF